MIYIGIDIGGMSIKGGVVDETGKLLAKDAVTTNTDASSDENVKTIALLCDQLMKKCDLSDNDVAGMGVGFPGTADDNTGIISYTCNINFRNYNFVKEFKKYHSFPVRIGNDADCAALGEIHFGDSKDVKNAILVTLGTGVGTGIIVDGKLITGNKGAGGEGGHFVICCGGEKCGCGRRGCWEAYASATALIRQTKQAMDKSPESLLHKVAGEEGAISGKTAFEAAKLGDKTAIAVVNRYLKYVGEGLTNLGNIFRPEQILIGGGISNEGDYVIEKLQRFVTRYSYGGKRNPKIIIKRASLLNNAGILGAAALCL